MITSYDAGGTWEFASSIKKDLEKRGHTVSLDAVGRGGARVKPTLENIDIAHFWNLEEMKQYPNLAIPTVATIHHIPVPGEGHYNTMLRKFRPDIIHVIDAFTLRQLGRWEFYNVVHIPQTFDHSKWQPLPFPETFTVGCMGDEKSLKRFDVIEAAARLANVPFIKMTSSPWKSEQERMDFFRSISCYVVASFEDGGPLPAQEALLCGRPVVTTHVGQMDRIIDEGASGCFHNGSIQDCARAILEAKDIDTDILSETADVLLAETEEVIPEYEALYEDLL